MNERTKDKIIDVLQLSFLVIPAIVILFVAHGESTKRLLIFIAVNSQVLLEALRCFVVKWENQGYVKRGLLFLGFGLANIAMYMFCELYFFWLLLLGYVLPSMINNKVEFNEGKVSEKVYKDKRTLFSIALVVLVIIYAYYIVKTYFDFSVF